MIKLVSKNIMNRDIKKGVVVNNEYSTYFNNINKL